MIASGALTKDYAKFNPLILQKKGRLIMAKQILNILKNALNRVDLKSLKVLDVGASSGIISNYVAKYFNNIIAIDVDVDSLKKARKSFRKRNLKFIQMDALKMKFDNESFDIAICNQVYCCFDNPKSFINEVYRVLKPGGIVFFGARNKYTLWDAQFHLPLLSFMPKFLADFMVRKFGNSKSFDVNYLDFWQLENLCKNFEIIKYTPKIMSNPKRYGYIKLIKYQKIFQFIPEVFWEFVEPTLPNFIWILKKPGVF